MEMEMYQTIIGHHRRLSETSSSLLPGPAKPPSPPTPAYLPYPQGPMAWPPPSYTLQLHPAYIQHPSPMIRINQPTHLKPWSTGLFSYLKDIRSCMLTTLCPCITAGQIMDILDEGRTTCSQGALLYIVLSLFCCTHMGLYRTRMREQYLLPGTRLCDCLVHCCCDRCALCQEYRELDHRGFDLSLGWDGNLERQRQAVAVFRITPPDREPSMRRS